MRILQIAKRIIESRNPDVVIGDPADPYLQRWYLIPRNRLFNVYLHRFLKSDDDRALHDHPWVSLSILLEGEYIEHTIQEGGIHKKKRITGSGFRFRSSKFAHRIEVTNQSAVTIFITGPAIRGWGFHCPEKGWVHWTKFVDLNNHGQIGKGCEG
ncbi:hypothetical protein CH380_19295 [Leptospira adleri]|uniref:Cupin domain-containing protein n=1 Tax=Leptospira adleri TaxID=2023186 RepID=A0A2M9YJ79_9LEPT|nr:hypothetical protein CH380_19295 [Leptospira adleri]PJZ61898.1 hypothetical protein CH376_10870 [Leptospira adleri]